MKKSAKVLIHGLLWALIFFTFFNILQALSGININPNFNSYSDSDLFIRTASTLAMLAIPFYSGYIVAPYLFKKRKRKLVITIAVISGIFYPIALSIADDGFRLSAVWQFFFAFAFLSLFMILGMGVRSLIERAAQK